VVGVEIAQQENIQMFQLKRCVKVHTLLAIQIVVGIRFTHQEVSVYLVLEILIQILPEHSVKMPIVMVVDNLMSMDLAIEREANLVIKQ